MQNRIRELRKARNLTMKQLGGMLGLAESTVSQYETGKRQPDNETLLVLGEIFGVTVGYLLGVENEKAPTPISEDERSMNIVKIAGRDGSFREKHLDDKGLQALIAFVDLLPDVPDNI